jgi:hypothetical protein
MDFQLQVDNLGQSNERAKLTLRVDGKNVEIPVHIQAFDYTDCGRVRTVSGEIDPAWVLQPKRTE